jgi:hypothetical protein
VGLLAALNAREDEDVAFAPLTVIVGVFLALLLVSVSGGHHHGKAHGAPHRHQG